MGKSKKKVFVAMSGGVDSSVTAALLQQRGFDVIGAHMKCYNVDGCGERDAEDARRVAEQLRIPFYVFDFEQEYKKRVVNYMVDGYQRGLTPNPDVMCNKEIKFGLFFKRALELGADYIATGHYVRLRNTNRCEYTNTKNSYIRKKFVISSLHIAKDKNKDQSYFLWTLTQSQLKHCLFPIGEYTKPQVRQMAKKFGLLTAEKKDSQGICFLGKVMLADFLKEYIPARRGAVVTTTGEKIGEHEGAHFYTIGQRHGFTTGIKKNVLGIMHPHYVIEKNTEKNILVVTEGKNNSELYKKEIELTNVNFINPFILNTKSLIPVLARVRYRQPLAPATLYKLKTNNYKLIFARPQKFIAPGQSAVFYSKKGEMLGGGIIV